MRNFHCSSLSWRGNWTRSLSDYRRKSASTCSRSSKTKVSERTPCSHLCLIIAAPALARARPPTAPRPPTRQRPIEAPGIGAWTIALPHWPIPRPRLPPLSCRRGRCRSVRIITCKKENTYIQLGSIMITMWDSNDINYLLILFFFFYYRLCSCLQSYIIFYFATDVFLSDDTSCILFEDFIRITTKLVFYFYFLHFLVSLSCF